MFVSLMKGKIHRAAITEADLNYEGSIAIDRHLFEAADMLVNERVEIYNIDTGARFATYVIEAPAGSGRIGLNGAAARLAMVGGGLCAFRGIRSCFVSAQGGPGRPPQSRPTKVRR